MKGKDKRLTKIKNDEPTSYSKIYDYAYGRFAKDCKYNITNGYKTKLMGLIIKDISDEEFKVLKNLLTFDFNVEVTSKATGIPAKELYRLYDLAMRHLYAPKLISLAVNKFYGKITTKDKYITKEDFGGKKYILSALNNNNIYTRKQLYKHLSYGWYFLWTIPGCGEAARQKILMALDSWNNMNVENRLPFYKNIGKGNKK